MKQAGRDTLNHNCSLHLSLEEAYLQQNKFLQVAEAFESLREFLVAKRELNFIDRVRLVRAHISLARLFQSHWPEAIAKWIEA
jgi:hypothetical protein